MFLGSLPKERPVSPSCFHISKACLVQAASFESQCVLQGNSLHRKQLSTFLFRAHSQKTQPLCDSLTSFNFLLAQSQPRHLLCSSLKALHEPQCIPQAAISFFKSIPWHHCFSCSDLRASNVLGFWIKLYPPNPNSEIFNLYSNIRQTRGRE